jgi:outer membrane protein OmpA-like peptidoglycan-associated protein
MNVGYDDTAVAVNENTSGLNSAATRSSMGRPSPVRSDGLVANKVKTPSDPKDSTQVTLESAPTAISKVKATDQPAIVIRKRDPWERMPDEDTALKSADVNSKTSGAEQAFVKQTPEVVSASQNAALQVQKFYLLFKPGSADLDDGSFDVLAQVSRLLSANPNSRITLALFFDPSSKSAYTSKLLALRANCIKSYLISKGVEARLTVVGRSAESLPEIEKPPGDGGMESWSEIRIETGKEG